VTYSVIETERDGSVLLVRLNRPARLNAYNQQMHDDLVRVYDEADADDGVRAVVVTGNGRAFCAGADLEKAGATFAREPSDEPHRDSGGVLNLRTYEFSKPVIAAINGPAVGVGATMTLPMDIRLAADTVKMGFVFARRGIVADGCASWFLPRVVASRRRWSGRCPAGCSVRPRRWRPAWCAACTRRTSCCRPRWSWPGRSRRTPRRCRCR